MEKVKCINIKNCFIKKSECDRNCRMHCKKSIFNLKTNRCEDVPKCIKNEMYDEETNTC